MKTVYILAVDGLLACFLLTFVAFPVFLGFIRNTFGWYIKVYPVPEGGKLRLTASGVSAANVTCGKSKLLQPSPKGANTSLLFALFEDDIICAYIPQVPLRFTCG